jgi:phytanoyl-CoA hydroxylase
MASRNLYRFDRVAPVLPCPEAVDDDSLRAYKQDGFLAVGDVLTPDETKIATQAMDDILHERVPGFGYTGKVRESGLQPEKEFRQGWNERPVEEKADYVRKIWRFVEFEPRLKALSNHPTIHTLLEKLLGEEAMLIQDMALLKPPRIGGEKPWHQDSAYFLYGPPEKVIGVWIAIDPATLENGCMHVLPGTHLEGAVPHIHERDCMIPDASVQIERDVAVPLEPGGAMFFSSLLHHGTPNNHSDQRRWALQFHYAAKSAIEMPLRSHAELFFEGDHYAGCRTHRKRLSEI